MRDAKIFQVKLLSDLFYPSFSFIQIFMSSIRGVDGRKILEMKISDKNRRSVFTFS